MRFFFPATRLRLLASVGVLVTLTSPAVGMTTPSPDVPPSVVADSTATAQPSPAPLDVSTRTVREAARASAEATNDSGADRLPEDQSKALKALQPTCNKLIALAELAAVVAICATDHCGYTGSDTDRSPSAGSAGQARTYPACISRGIKLW